VSELHSERFKIKQGLPALELKRVIDSYDSSDSVILTLACERLSVSGARLLILQTISYKILHESSMFFAQLKVNNNVLHDRNFKRTLNAFFNL